MLEILTIVLFCWLSFKLLGLFFRMAWGMLILVPLGLLALAFGILKACV